MVVLSEILKRCVSTVFPTPQTLHSTDPETVVVRGASLSTCAAPTHALWRGNSRH